MDEAFLDKVAGELVCLTTLNDVIDYLAKTFDQVILAVIPYVEPGVVLVDSKGEGAFQVQT